MVMILMLNLLRDYVFGYIKLIMGILFVFVNLGALARLNIL